MKKVILALCNLLLAMPLSYAQHKPLLYDFYEIPQAIMLNPGMKTPFQWHVGVPLLSGFSMQAGTSGVTVNDLFANDGLDFTTKIRDRVVNSMVKNDELGGSGQIELIHVGFRSRNRPDDYFSFGMYGEGFLSLFWPQDLAILAFEGNGANIGRRFNLNHIAMEGEAVNVLHFGINRSLNDAWTVGARAKVYSSVFGFRSANNTGSFVTLPGQDNILRNTIDADVTLRTSGVKEFLDIIDEDTDTTRRDLIDKFISRSLFGGNLGLGFDLGFTHNFGNRGHVTASLLDLGFIYHTNAIENYTVKGTASNEGVFIELPEDLTNFNNDLWRDLVDDLEEKVPFDTNEKAFITLRPIKLNASLRYNLGASRNAIKDCGCALNTTSSNGAYMDYVSAVGGHLSMIYRPRGPQAALTAFYQHRLANTIILKSTYTIDKYSLSNIGLGFNLQAGPVNMYVLADNLLGYANIADSNYASLQFGFNILSWNSN
ncbi:MAG: DUF5723 family protein [Bacteroidota bacterium]